MQVALLQKTSLFQNMRRIHLRKLKSASWAFILTRKYGCLGYYDFTCRWNNPLKQCHNLISESKITGREKFG